MTSLAPTRRVFIQAHELPGLTWGALAGHAVSMRRILGARRGGRIGIGLFTLGLVAAVPAPIYSAHFLALHLGLGFAGTALQSGSGSPRIMDRLRLSLWTAWPLLLTAALAKGIGLNPWGSTTLAILIAHALLTRGLARGMD